MLSYDRGAPLLPFLLLCLLNLLTNAAHVQTHSINDANELYQSQLVHDPLSPAASLCASEGSDCSCAGAIYMGANSTGPFARLYVYNEAIVCSFGMATSDGVQPWLMDPAPGMQKLCYCDPSPYQEVAFPFLARVHSLFAQLGNTIAGTLFLLSILVRFERCECLKQVSEDRKWQGNLAEMILSLSCWLILYLAYLLSSPNVTQCWALLREVKVMGSPKSIESDISTPLTTIGFLFGLLFWSAVIYILWKVPRPKPPTEESQEGQSWFQRKAARAAPKAYDLAVLTLKFFMQANLFVAIRFKWFTHTTCPLPGLPLAGTMGTSSFAIASSLGIVPCAGLAYVALKFLIPRHEDDATANGMAVCLRRCIGVLLLIGAAFTLVILLGFGAYVACVAYVVDKAESLFEFEQTFFGVKAPGYIWVSSSVASSARCDRSVLGLILGDDPRAPQVPTDIREVELEGTS